MIFEELKTERLVLRKLTHEVYRFIYENYSDDELIIFLSLKSKEELYKEKEKYGKGLSTFNKSFLYFQLFDIHTKKYIGDCGFHTWYIEHNRAEIFYTITDNALKGKGLMTEAMNKVIDYGFRNMNLNRIEAFVGSDNLPSLNLLNKFGFTNEGNLREHYKVNDKIEDSLVFSLLRNEYKQKA